MLRVAIACAVIAGVAALATATPGRPRDPKTLDGWALYDRYCLACHGASGDGRGPAAAYTKAKPRAFVTGEYEWRSTPIGQPPTDGDLRLAIRRGAPGTSMHPFDTLSSADVDRLVTIVKAFAPTPRTPAVPIVLGAMPVFAPARGAQLWTQLGCVSCHGARGAGDGPSADKLPERPYDLTTQPLRRPRDADDRDARRRAAALSIATGMTGTAMPGYAGAIPDGDVWALADHVIELGANARDDRRTLGPIAIAADRATPIINGTWTGHDPDEAIVWGTLVAPQGAPPPSLAPAEASLSARQCARCHAKQHREWQGSLHNQATSPGFLAQTFDKSPKQAAACRKCHAPLAEQASDQALRDEGLQCAGCHVRGWTRRGPPNLAPSLLRDPSYPLTTLAIYERSDFCMPCHQLSPRLAVEGRPLLDTYREWLEGPYMRRGIQCQHCHMPNREHTFRGIHDPETVRQGIALTARAHLANGAVTVTAEVRNVGAGHYLPTTTTPALWLVVELVDANSVPTGARYAHRIGRDIENTSTGWIEKADTRIPPGERLAIGRTWSASFSKHATHARIGVEVAPDDYYTRLYEQRLETQLPPARRALYEQALARTRASGYLAERRLVPIVPR